MQRENKAVVSPAEVVRLLIEPTGESVMKKIDRAITPDLRRVGVVGKPGVGKTTIGEGLETILVEEYSELISFIPYLAFDRFRREFLNIKAEEGLIVESIPELPKKDRKEFAAFLRLAFFDGTDLSSESRTVYRFELVGMGKHDRGQEALKRMAQRNNKSHQVETFLLHVISDPAIVAQAKIERDVAKKAKNDWELLHALRSIGVDVREPTEEDKNKTVLLQYYLTKASSKQIDMIDKEVEPALKKFEKRVFKTSHKESISTLKHLLEIPPGVRIETEDEWKALLIEILFAYNHLLNLEFAPHCFAIVLNQFAGNIKH